MSLRLTFGSFALVLLLLGVASPTKAQTNAVSNGNWSTGATWDNGEPESTTPTAAFINDSLTVTIDQNGEETNLVDVGSIEGQTGTLQIDGGSLIIFNPSGEPLSGIRLGQVLGSSGTLNMTGGAVFIDGDSVDPLDFADGDILIGDNGDGVMNMSGGTFDANDEVFVGFGGGSSGELNISGGMFSVLGRNLLVGFGGSNPELEFTGAEASLNVSGDAVVNIDEFLFSGFFDGAKSTLTQTGGTINVGQAAVLGRRGNSTVNHSGGALNVLNNGNGDFVVGDGGPNTIYNISGSATVDAARNLLVGVFGDAEGTVNQSGGTINAGGFLSIGRDGLGTWNQTDGATNVAGSAFLGDFDSSLGTYQISGGTLNVIGNLSIGGALASNAPPDAERLEPSEADGPQGQALDANGVLIVSGAGGTINVGGNLLANPADKGDFRKAPNAPDGDNSATLVFELFGDEGTSLIDVAGVADLDGAMIDLDLMSGYVPMVGMTFDLLTAASFGATGSGTTQDVGTGQGFTLAAEDNGAFSLAVVAGGNGQILQATFLQAPTGLAGDFNDDGVVNAADYTVWRDNLGGDESALSNNGDGANGVDQGDYDLWRTNYGDMASTPPFSGAAPEPMSIASLVLAAAGVAAGRRRRI